MGQSIRRGGTIMNANGFILRGRALNRPRPMGRRGRLPDSLVMGCVVLLLTGWGSMPAKAESPRTVVYPILFGDPAALETYARTVVGEEGHVVLDARGQRLIVLAPAALHAELNQVLGEADARTGNVRIQIQFRDRERAQDRGAAVGVDGDIVFGPGGRQADIRLEPRLRHTVTDQRSDTQQMIMAASGREAILRVGEQVPYLEWITTYAWHGGYTSSRVNWQDVGSFLVVTPTILPDGSTVHIRLTPELRGRVDHQPYRQTFTTLATEVYVLDGQTIPIGGAVDDQEFYSRFLIGMDRQGRTRQLEIELTPQIVQPDGRVRSGTAGN